MNAIRGRYDHKIEALPDDVRDNSIIYQAVQGVRVAHWTWEQAMQEAAIALAREHKRLTDHVIKGAHLRPPAPILLCADCPQRERIESELHLENNSRS